MSHQPTSNPELSAEQRKVLEAQTIKRDEPGTILRDFEALLGFVAEHQVTLSGVLQLPAAKLLPDLNACLAHPLDIQLQRPVVKSYPHLHGLYWLLRATGLALAHTVGKSRVLQLELATLDSWRGLNPTEQYFTLLEAWLRLADEDAIGEHAGALRPLDRCLSFLKHMPISGKSILSKGDEEGLRYFPALHNLALLEEFGLVAIRRGETRPNGGWRVEHVAVTPWGDAVFALLTSSLPTSELMGFGIGVLERLAAVMSPELLPPEVFEDEIEDEDEPDSEEPLFGQWQEMFQPFFPSWQHNLQLPEPEIKTGLYVWKVSLDKVWRRIAIPSHLTLDELSAAILRAFSFDNDHLYLFAFRNDFGSTVEVVHPMMHDSPSTLETIVGQLPLRPGDSMTFVFDFGDHWEFSLLLERIDPPDASVKHPRVLEKQGKAPKQYP